LVKPKKDLEKFSFKYQILIFLGVYEIQKEDYFEKSNCLKEIILELENLSHVEINKIKYDLNFVLCSDFKMLRNLFGQKASNAKVILQLH
jgi:hypothetical protein